MTEEAACCDQGDHSLGIAIRHEHQRHESHGASATGTSRPGSDLGVWGSIVSSPSRVWGGAPAIISQIQIKSELIFGHRWVSIWLQTCANLDKSGAPSQKRNCVFCQDTSLKIGTVPEYQGRMVTLAVTLQTTVDNSEDYIPTIQHRLWVSCLTEQYNSIHQ